VTDDSGDCCGGEDTGPGHAVEVSAERTRRGRVVGVEGQTVRLVRLGASFEADVDGAPPAPGDVVEIDTDTRACRVLTPWRGPPGGLATWARAIGDPRRLRGTRVRREVECGIRAFFDRRQFTETRTPIRVPCPGLEPHIKPFELTAGGFLHTSPELAMKRLLVGGLERIYQLATVFRDEPSAPTHLAEFTMLEWYRAYADEHAIMADTEQLVAKLATALHGSTRVPHAGGTIDLTPPWPRRTVRELFAEHVGVDLREDTDLRAACARAGVACAADDGWDDLYFRLWMERVEPRLPADRPVFVTRYPASQAALAVVDSDADGTRWARRFEVYVGGLELANAFYELTDPVLQRRRFEDDLALRARVHGDTYPVVPLDEGFLGALAEGMPPSAGIALGVDRLVMLLADERDIAFTTWLRYDF
jgi:lysyl-tRNA synthetase class 2